MSFDFLLNNDIQNLLFPSTDLKFGMFIYHACADFWKRIKILKSMDFKM